MCGADRGVLVLIGRFYGLVDAGLIVGTPVPSQADWDMNDIPGTSSPRL